MKVLILSANFGFIDDIRPQTTQTIQTDYKTVDSGCFDGYPDRIRGKMLKISIPFLDICKGYDFVIWKDARVQIANSAFVEYMIDMAEMHNIGAVLHPERKTLADEYDYILKNINKPYLQTRYKDYDFAGEIQYFNDVLGHTLYNPRVFIVNMADRKMIDDFFHSWRMMIEDTTWFDQTQFSVALQDLPKLKVKDLYWQDLEKYCIIHKHDKLI